MFVVWCGVGQERFHRGMSVGLLPKETAWRLYSLKRVGERPRLKALIWLPVDIVHARAIPALIIV